MRKLLFVLAVIIALAVLWIFAGRNVAVLVDRFWTIQTESVSVHSIAYEGTGAGGVLQIENSRLSLSPADPKADPPHIGSTKSDQLALASSGKVFSFGAPSASENQALAADIQPGDTALFQTAYSPMIWPNPGMLMKDPRAWRRYQYQTLLWTKQNGEKLQLIWRLEQFFDPGKGWSTGVMTHGGVTGLIRIEISGTSR